MVQLETQQISVDLLNDVDDILNNMDQDMAKKIDLGRSVSSLQTDGDPKLSGKSEGSDVSGTTGQEGGGGDGIDDGGGDNSGDDGFGIDGDGDGGDDGGNVKGEKSDGGMD